MPLILKIITFKASYPNPALWDVTKIRLKEAPVEGGPYSTTAPEYDFPFAQPPLGTDLVDFEFEHTVQVEADGLPHSFWFKIAPLNSGGDEGPMSSALEVPITVIQPAPTVTATATVA